MPLALPLALVLVLVGRPAVAQEAERSLHWDEIQVEARLDADGRLHVEEHQGIVFDGEWNGGAREFETRLGQRFRLQGVTRIDPRTGDSIRLAQDDEVDDVDEYDLDDELVWRSRLEDDPPFDDRRLDYVLEYTINNAVIPTPDGYLLDHDFLFPDRAGMVDTFRLTLTLDPPWSTSEGRVLRWAAEDVPPGRSLSVRVPLRYEGDGSPATVPGSPPGGVRLGLVLLLLAAPLALGTRFFRRERADGRYEPLPRVPDEAWLEEHLFRYPPELVGAAWDGATSAAEVAGLLARLVAEEKLGSHVERDDDTGDPVLHLELLVPRDTFSELERPLIDALFFDGRESTDTRTVREHYEDSGFDAAGTIREALQRRVEDLPGRRLRRRVWPAWAGVAAAVLVLVTAAAVHPPDAPVAAIVGIFAFTGGMLLVMLAYYYAQSVVGLGGKAVAFVLLAAGMVLGLAAVVGGILETTALDGERSPYYRSGPLLLFGLAALGVAFMALAFRIARPRDEPARLRLRRRMAAARAFFRRELGKADPDLRDEWFPYLLAFGLGARIDQWFESFGGDSGAAAPVPAAAGVGATTSGGAAAGGSFAWTGGGATFGGGGGFSGGGVGGSWATAATTVASGVTSSSAGTAGGIASSGGGGGGGW